MISGHQCRLMLTAAAAILFAEGAAAQAPAPVLTQAELVRQLTENPSLVAAAQGRRGAADARARAAGARPGPELEVVREGGDGLSGTNTEDSARLRYQLDLGGVRAAERRAGLARRDAELADLGASTAARIGEARRLYVEASGLAGRASVRRLLADRLTAAEAVVRRRVDEGDAADLELRRVEAEAATARTGAGRLESEAAAKWAELQGYLGPAAGTYAPPPGVPAPTPLEPLDSYLARLDEAPAARRAAAEVRAAQMESEALARRARTPQTSLVGGLRTVDNTIGRQTGFIVGASVTLPFSRGPRAEADARSAEASALRAEQRVADEMRRNGVIAAWSLAQRLSAATPAARPPEAILPPTEAAYAAGEIDATDLIAAHRTAVEAALARIDLAQEAALARIRLDELVGKTTP
jgi:outer membrane protein TolC